MCFFFFQAEDGIRDLTVTGVQTCALPISGNPFEAGLGLVVGSCIAALWIKRIRLREREDSAVAAGSAQHLEVLGSVRRQEVRLAQFIWIVLPLELAFLTPWWVIGTRVHHRSLTDGGSWQTVWLRRVGCVGVFLGSGRRGGGARVGLGGGGEFGALDVRPRRAQRV